MILLLGQQRVSAGQDAGLGTDHLETAVSVLSAVAGGENGIFITNSQTLGISDVEVTVLRVQTDGTADPATDGVTDNRLSDVTTQVNGGDIVLIVTANDLTICGARYTATISATPIFSYGDINRDGSADADDLICMLDGLSGQLDCIGVTADYLDIAPCGGGDGDGNLRDLLALLDTLAGELLCPKSCL